MVAPQAAAAATVVSSSSSSSTYTNLLVKMREFLLLVLDHFFPSPLRCQSRFCNADKVRRHMATCFPFRQEYSKCDGVTV